MSMQDMGKDAMISGKENNEEYYYQCQKKNCELDLIGPKPCKQRTTTNSGNSTDGFCIHTERGECVLWKEITKEQYDMISTMRVNYFDGSYYTVRKDKPGWEDIIEKINKKKGQKFLCDLTKEEQLSTIKNVDLVKITEVEMTEEDYMKIPESTELVKIRVELNRD